MPVVTFKHNLIKIGKRQYRNPICLAKEWRESLDNGEYASPADLARHLGVSRARVTQLLNLLHLSPEVIGMISSLGDSNTGSRRISEKMLRPLTDLSADQQKAQVKVMLSKSKHGQA